MQNNNIDTKHELLVDNFDFIEWKELHEQDPQAFEEQRKTLLESAINSAPPQYQQRLRGIMFQVDAVRVKSKNPLHSCIAISEMMHKTLDDLRYFLKDLSFTLNGNNELKDRNSEKIVEATILGFKK